MDGVVQTSDGQEESEEFIFDETEVRFHLAAEAPIERTQLIHQLGYLGDSTIAQQIIEGTYDIPEEVDDATAMILTEIGKIGVHLTNGDTTITITPEEFQFFWRRIREGTASSYSGVHYGHYKAAAHSDRISSFLAKKITLIARTGCPPDRWGHGLTVMLEKVAGIALVNKLRAILLMEADFNFHNKLLFGKRMMATARAHGLVPPEQYSEKESTAEDGTFDKILQSDISRQFRQRMGIISADATNCYDRIHHAIMALVFLALCVGKGPIASMLTSIQLMKFFLRTGWGESTRSIGGNIANIFHGLCQGNGAAPAGWLVLSSILVRLLKQRGFGTKVTSPVSHVLLDIMGVIYVDDTDLMIMRAGLRNLGELWQECQDATTAWGELLISTGGALKPPKSFYYLIDYEWEADGTWTYTDTVDLPPLTVPLPDGTSQPINCLPPDESKKTLGIHTNPAGLCQRQLDHFHDALKEWTNRLSIGKLPAKWAWVSYLQQLWPRLRYGLGTNSSPVEDLVDAEEGGGPLRALYRKMLPFLGVNRNITGAWRHLHSTFGGIGLRKILPEVVIARVNLFLQHFSTRSTLGTKLTVSLEALQLEAGVNDCPLSHPYLPFGPLATPCWCRSFWQGLDHYGFKIDMDYPHIPLPRQGDCLLISLFQDHDPGLRHIRSLHRCRMAWRGLFLSDIVAADGRRLDPKYLKPPCDVWPAESSYSFAEERRPERTGRHGLGFGKTSPDRDLSWPAHWAIGYLLPTGRGAGTLTRSVTNLTVAPRPGWYPTRSGGGHRTQSGRSFFPREVAVEERPPRGVPATVTRTDEGGVRLLCRGSPLAQRSLPPLRFFDFLRRRGGEWMWTNIVNEGRDLRWVEAAMRNGTAIWVTDGSYNRKTAPHVSGAGWMLHCTASGRRLFGSFYERSPNAGSYRAELLGLLAIHVLVAALEEYFDLPPHDGKICCDNRGALYEMTPNARCGKVRW